MRIGRIEEFNDPFELLGWTLEYKFIRKQINGWKKDINEKMGIICFSGNRKNPLLWSHYAEGHRGIALGFDVQDKNLYKKVNYVDKRFPSGGKFGRLDFTDERLLLTKFSSWRYESEYRCLVNLFNEKRDGDNYFEEFSRHLELSCVIVGAQSSITRIEIETALGDEYAHIRRFKARAAFRTFEVVENRDKTLW